MAGTANDRSSPRVAGPPQCFDWPLSARFDVELARGPKAALRSIDGEECGLKAISKRGRTERSAVVVASGRSFPYEVD